MNLNDEDINSAVECEDTLLLKEVPAQGLPKKNNYRAHVILHIFLLYCFVGALTVTYLSLLDRSRECRDLSQRIYCMFTQPPPHISHRLSPG